MDLKVINGRMTPMDRLGHRYIDTTAQLYEPPRNNLATPENHITVDSETSQLLRQ
jgi:hypothetical protein